MKKRALVSVSDKTGLLPLVKTLIDDGYEIISTGGTAKYIVENGMCITPVEKVTGFPECFGGRIKTLHPMIHGGILFDRTDAEHAAQAKLLGIEGIDIVVVNFYPFEKVCNDRKSTHDDKIENIDIGGPAMVRAAAKNYGNITVVTQIGDYEDVLRRIKKTGEGGLDLEYRKNSAAKAFLATQKYDEAVARFLLSDTHVSGQVVEDKESCNIPEIIDIRLKKVLNLRYGENPHQKGAFYVGENDSVCSEKNDSILRQLGGKELSYNNYLDMNEAVSIVSAFKEPACTAIKHGTPCGAAVSCDSTGAYIGAYSCDTESVFGAVVAFNTRVDLKCAEELAKTFIEAVIAPEFTKDAVEHLRKKKNLRIIASDPKKTGKAVSGAEPPEIRRAMGGYLIQTGDAVEEDEFDLRLMTSAKIGEDKIKDVVNALAVCKRIRSNAIVIFKEGKMIGIGAGHTSRVRAFKSACENSMFPLEGAVMASDGFFPFPDSIQLAAEKGIGVIAAPCGSLNDGEVVETAEKLGITLFFIENRHFKH